MVTATRTRSTSGSFDQSSTSLRKNSVDAASNQRKLSFASQRKLSFSETSAQRKLSADYQRKRTSSFRGTSTTTEWDAAARILLEMLLQVRNSQGCGLLHHCSSSSSSSTSLLPLARSLLQRADSLASQFLSQADFESGYTPLHTAIYRANLPTVLLLLRFPLERFSERPLQRLEQQHEHLQDAEGLSPAALLSRLQVSNLSKIRTALKHQEPSSSSQEQPRSRNSSTSSDDEQDEFAEDYAVLQQSEVNDTHDNAFNCHVMTFGAAHHAALGVSDTTKNAHMTNRPQRVLLPGAIQVVAATHHSLFLTQDGHVYACGLGQGGRLGIAGVQESSIPMRVALKRSICYIAAADNHSLAVSREGHVYAWGSNRFGQLTGSTTTGGTKGTPIRVTLPESCSAVAAGERHSVALSRSGTVYTWGDNAAGQLGRQRKAVTKVDVVQHALVKKQVLQIEASEQSTLVLVAKSLQYPSNAVYSWGHGNPVPIKVNFKTATTKSSAHQHIANPIDISSAQHHNAAVTFDGTVYTWGIESHLATPVDGLANCHYVSSSDHHTAVVTTEGHLYTWGATHGLHVMGHEGLRYQREPKRVPGVHGAVRVAVAKEHTVLLVGSTNVEMPASMSSSSSSLTELCALEICRHVDLFNVIPILISAERLHSNVLREFCHKFIAQNLDQVLNVARKSELDVYLKEQLAEQPVNDEDGDKDYAILHPLLLQVLRPEVTSSQEWLEGSQAVLDALPVSTRVRYSSQPTIRRRSRAVSFQQHQDEKDHQEQSALQIGVEAGCSEQCLALTSGLSDVLTEDEIRSKYQVLSKQVRSLTKRLTQMTRLEEKDDVLSTEERDKLHRKPLLEADLSHLKPALERAEKLMTERNLNLRGEDPMTTAAKKKECDDKPVHEEEDKASFYCAVCNVTCPDGNHLELHRNGRKHRNRVKQVEQEERDETAAAILRQQQQEALGKNDAVAKDKAAVRKKKNPWTKKSSIEPRYQLPPPPIPPGPMVTPSKGNTLEAKNNKWAAPPASPSGAVVTSKKSTVTLSSPAATLKSPLLHPAQATSSSWATRPESSSRLLNPGPIAPLKNAPWNSAPFVNVATTPKKQQAKKLGGSMSGSGKKAARQSLGEFLHGPTPVKKKAVTATAPWLSSSTAFTPPKMSTPATPASSNASSNTQRKKTLLEIQLEEESKELRQVATDGPAKWFQEVRVDRSTSLSAIQQAEAKEREMQLLIAEQLEIESQIKKELQKQQQTAKRKNSKSGNDKKGGNSSKRGGKKKTNQEKKDPPSNTQPQSERKNRKPRGKKKPASEAKPAVSAS